MPTEIYESDDDGLHLGGTADVTFVVFIAIDFNWTTNTAVSISQSFYWDVGTARTKWYRVIGECEYITSMPPIPETNEEIAPDPSGRTIRNATAPIETNDPSCDGKDQKHFFVQEILANSPREVCDKLKETNWIWKIITMQEHGCPANLTEKLPGEDCNALYNVEFCGFPECEDFCVDYFAEVFIGAIASVVIITDEEGEVQSDRHNYLFNPDTDDDDPGSLYVSFDQPLENIHDITRIFISRLDQDGNDQTDWYDTFDESENSIKGEITITDLSENVICVFHVVDEVIPRDVDDNGTFEYFKIPVKQIEGTTLPDEDEEVIIIFSPDVTPTKEIVPESDLEIITPIIRTVRPSCASWFNTYDPYSRNTDVRCWDIPYKLYCHNNLTQYDSNFNKFLKRNGLTASSEINLQYSANRDSWLGSSFYFGVGDDSQDFQEQWKFLVEWACMPINEAANLLDAPNFGGINTQSYVEAILYGEDLDLFPPPTKIGLSDVYVAVWFLRFWVQRKKVNTITKEKINFNTFFYAMFNAGSICSLYPDGLIDFSMKFNFQENRMVDLASSFCYDSSILERIGLFNSKDWAKDPFLKLKVSWLENPLPADKFNISSLLG